MSRPPGDRARIAQLPAARGPINIKPRYSYRNNCPSPGAIPESTHDSCRNWFVASTPVTKVPYDRQDRLW